MKNILIVFIIFFTLPAFGQTSNELSRNEVGTCFISFKKASNLTSAEPERRPETAGKERTLKTGSGEFTITSITGYRVLYNNDKKATFVNLKVELIDSKVYEETKKNLLDNLQYQIALSQNMESKEPIVMELNGYKIYGLSRTSIEAANTLGTFMMFPGNGIIVYFYFSNIKEGYRHFENVNEYKKHRDTFLNEYTKHLSECK